MNPMLRAVGEGDTAKVREFLDHGSDLNARYGQAQMTPLKLAADKGRLDIAQLLLERGADANLRIGGSSALTLAAQRGDLPMIRFLLSKGAEVAERDISWARAAHRAEAVSLLLAASSRARETSARAETAAPDLEKPAFQVGEHADDAALVVDAELYMDLPQTPFAQRDGDAVSRYLLAMGVPERNIVHLSGKQARRLSVSKYLERWLPNNVNSNSRVFFYFSGRGATDEKTGRAYLLPWDGDAEHLEATGYPIESLFDSLAKLGARQAVALLETGFSGHAPVNGVDMGLSKQGSVICLTAATGTAEPNRPADRRHGLMTYYFLKGLDGEAAAPGGHVTIRGLFRYLRAKVEEASGPLGPPQTPQLLTGALGEGDLDLR